MQSIDTIENKQALAALERGLTRVTPHAWVCNRIRTLKGEAVTMRAGINVAKTTSIAGTVVAGGAGLLMGATGIGLIGGGIGALTYLAVLVADGLDTGRFAPLPFIRTRVGERMEMLGDAELRALKDAHGRAQLGAGKSNYEQDEELYSNLPSELCQEALMLRKHGALVVKLLEAMPVEQRNMAYMHLCDAYQTFGDALTGMTPQRLSDTVNGRVSGDYSRMQPAEFGAYQQPVYQVQPTSDRTFGELPAAQPVGNTTRLTAVDVPAEPVPPAQQKWDAEPENLQIENSLQLLRQAIGFPAVLVHGPAGSGKSTFVKWLVSELAKAGYDLEVLDPHKAYGDWPGLTCYGEGNDLAACDERLQAFMDKVNARYRERANKPDYNPKPMALITEEFTKWSDECDHAPAFFKCSISDIRKVKMAAVYVSHANTLAGLGGAKGMAKTRDNGLIQIELFATQGPDNQPVPSGKGRITFPGGKAIELTLPDFRKLMPARPVPVAVPAQAVAVEQASNAHPKVQRFAGIVAEFFAANPGRSSVGLGRIISSNAKLKGLRSQGHKDVIERLVTEAADHGLIDAEQANGGWSVSMSYDDPFADVDLGDDF